MSDWFIVGTHVAHPTCTLAAAEVDVEHCWDSVPVTCADRRPRLDYGILCLPVYHAGFCSLA